MKEVGKISDLCTVIAGQSPAGSSYNENGIGIEFHQGKKAFGSTTLMPSGVWTTEITKLALPGDILMSVRAPVGPTNMTDRQICIGRGLAAIRCKNEVIPSYVLYALRNIESKIVGNDGAVFNSINKKMIENLPLPLLTASEQEEIVTYLDTSFAKIDAIKANAEKELEEAKRLFAAALNEAMTPKEGWVEKTLGEIFDVRDGTHDSPKYVETGYPLVTSKNLKGSYIDFCNVKYIKEEDYAKINERSKVDIGDVLFAMIGTIGNATLVENTPNYAIKNMALFKTKSLEDGKFLKYLLQSEMILSEMRSQARGTTQHFVSLGYLRNYSICIPTEKDQQAIVAHLDTLSEKVRQLQSNYEKISSECEALKQAILRDTFE